MQLSAGDTLGPYEIVARIGAGGMGVVYRARDPRLGRDVAIKVSNEHFSDRFEREARAVAALNHANICTLHDVGPNYLVLELVEGEPLKGPLPVETALDYARQIADALDAAHERGIVHRDLKPGNITVRSDGTVKVLDFGLAKIGSGATGQHDPSQSPTVSMDGTRAGTILGTASYMAPEQARGKAVDKRADIWAFGAVVYEMLTGRRAFDGEDVSTIVAAVIHLEPRWDGVPARVRPLLESCFEKDPRKRLRDIGDVWRLLDDRQAPAAPEPRSVRTAWLAAAALAVVAVIAVWAPWRAAPRDDAPGLVRLDVELGSDVALSPLVAPTFSSLTISPDASRLVFVGGLSAGAPRLLTRRLGESNVADLAGTEGALNPFFSPDGRWVAFWNNGRLSKVSLEGGAIVPLADLAVMTGGTWAHDGSLVVGSGVPGVSGLVRIPADGGSPSPLLELAGGELFYSFPQMLPGRNEVLIAVVGTPASPENTNVVIVSLDDRRQKTLVRGGTSPRYLASGHLIYATRAGMVAVAFDLDTWETRGAAVPVMGEAAFDPLTGGAQYGVAHDGTLVYRHASGRNPSTTAHLRWLDRTGTATPLVLQPGEYAGTPRLSPEGRRIAIAMRDGANQHIWIHDRERDAMTRLTSGSGVFVDPVWSRDGRYVIFGSHGLGLLWTRADGAGQPQVLLDTRSLQLPTSLTADGTRLAFQQMDGTVQVWSVELEDDGNGLKAGTPTRFLTTAFNDSGAAFAPDGRWVAYESTESGRPEVYVRPFPAPTSGNVGKVQISVSGGGSPAWMPHGRELLYQAGGRIMTVGYATSGGSFRADRPRVWAEGVDGSAGFDIAPDGTGLAISQPAAQAGATRREHTIVYVRNFLDELRQRAPIAR